MKKLFIIGSLCATLFMGACNRKATCPAYGSVQKPAPAQVRA
ncbi:hypothetical protein BN8_05971 [Fibrisoma limi BUZ 3]|uniref:Lipoprotein n=1 Tax=Fibrisoma limi BUZ 3 TaxID=1185876 RepID=I2GRR8_9BACT|nr:hypothetical protein [Fibrisoma limi]CCH56596.1 hypothetical protein BN8_05971 [Fibrisoma limi BUZ 3]